MNLHAIHNFIGRLRTRLRIQRIGRIHNYFLPLAHQRPRQLHPTACRAAPAVCVPPATRASATALTLVMSGAAFEKNNEHRWPAFCGDERAGEVTQAVYSPRLERNIGFALLDVEYLDDGRSLTVDTPEGVRHIELTSTPFIDPDKTIPRQPLR